MIIWVRAETSIPLRSFGRRPVSALLQRRISRYRQAGAVHKTVFTCLLVALYVYEPSQIELSAPETVRLDRLAFSDVRGWTAEQHGDLLRPGSTALQLDAGVYHFRTIKNARLRLGQASTVQVVSPSFANGKDPWPDPPPPPPPPLAAGAAAAQWTSHPTAFLGGGFGVPDRVPALSVVYGDV